MYNFSDFNIKVEPTHFVGPKLPPSAVIGTQIKVIDYDIRDSKFEGFGLCTHIQIEIYGQKKVIFTGSKYLRESIEQVGKDRLPFNTTIIKKDDGSYAFT